MASINSLKDFTSCECDLPEYGQQVPSPFPDPDNESETDPWFRFAASRNRNCYDSDFWKVTDPESKSTYNFLDYVGTGHMAHDLDRLRQAFGAEKPSINGISYGAAVGSSYAAVFPKNTDKLLLNGNVYPGPNVEDYCASAAVASRHVMVKLVKICRNELAETCHQNANSQALTLWISFWRLWPRSEKIQMLTQPQQMWAQDLC
ncbi:unnamed protein product [Durusdinium trenchii]|uniref:AB hydrolase-1 domain-containing protein n=1 Tax=Durusdinium trenchii TaxID=1381693 RepID=A0ABP0NMY4_9DINO